MYRVPVRKYFEIPALGAMPVGQMMEGFEEIGFKCNENFILAETPEAVRQILADYDETHAQTIASNARNLIIAQHSEPARASQLADSFERILNGSFEGSYWSNGIYCHH